MIDAIEKMRERSEELLRSGEVDQVIGWSDGTFFWQARPLFVTDPGEVGRLSCPPSSQSNLVKYMVDVVRPAPRHERKGRTAIWTRGCDARAINRLMTDGVIQREDVYILGFHCPGIASPEKLREAVGGDDRILSVDWEEDGGELQLVVQTSGGERRLPASEVLEQRCLNCTHPEPVISDEVFGEPLREVAERDRAFAGLREMERLGVDERFAQWARNFDRCIRCYACRNVCPACNCKECVFDSALPDQPDWLSKASTLSEKQIFHVIRAFHVAGRCIECGQCERVCPMDLPLTDLMMKAASDIEELFGPHEAGLDPDEVPPLQTYRKDDPELEGGNQS
ncbi:MAG: 4Fe-4S dicluster domain-containing protein [Bacillota bacterium]